MDISAIENKFSEHTILYDDIMQAIEKAKIKIHFPISNKVLGDLSKRTEYIFKGMMDVARQDNLYAAFILYRSLIEHFFKGMYIVDKMVSDMSDTTAENYQKHYFLSEYLAEQAGVLEMEDLINDSQSKTDFIKFITKKMPELEGFDKANQQEISAATKQFSLKEIVKHLHAKHKQRNSLAANSYVVAQTLPEYSHVCTYTHGGSYASVLMEKFIRENDIHGQLTRILHISLTTTCVTKENFFMTYEIGAYFKDYLLSLQNIRKF